MLVIIAPYVTITKESNVLLSRYAYSEPKFTFESSLERRKGREEEKKKKRVLLLL